MRNGWEESVWSTSKSVLWRHDSCLEISEGLSPRWWREMLSVVPEARQKSREFKLQGSRFHLGIGANFLIISAIKQWSCLEKGYISKQTRML